VVVVGALLTADEEQLPPSFHSWSLFFCLKVWSPQPYVPLLPPSNHRLTEGSTTAVVLPFASPIFSVVPLCRSFLRSHR